VAAPTEYTPERAIELVERVKDETAGRRKRQDGDYLLQRSEGYDTNTGAEGSEVGTEYKSFTSTIAAAFVRKVVSILALAKVNIRVPYGTAQRQQRHIYDMKERFAYGVLEQCDEELRDLVQIEAHDQFSWFTPNRGWLIALALFRNLDDGRSVPMLRPWDPLNTYWQVGKDGLAWACTKMMKTVADIRAEYPGVTILGEEDDERTVYNFWTPEKNSVFTEDKEVLKKWTAHGSPRVPVIIVPVPTQPNIWSESVANSADDYGESVLATNRSIYPFISEVMSITLDLLEKARQPAAIAFTAEEDTEFEEDPQRQRGVSYMGEKDKFQVLPAPETTKDAIQFMQMALGMVQRGDLPFTTYGEIQFALSGYAITQLNQQLLTVIGPQTRAMARGYEQILNLFLDQYVSGQFNPITVRGLGNNRDYMQMEIPPQALMNLAPYKVEVVAELPQDDIAKLTAAQSARGFLPDRWLRDEFIKVPNADLIDRMLKEQMAETTSPRAIALELAKASLEAGRPDLAQVYIDEMMMQAVQLQLQKMALMAPQGGGAPGATTGQPPTVLPFIEQQGGQQPAPNPPTGEEGRFGFPRNR